MFPKRSNQKCLPCSALGHNFVVNGEQVFVVRVEDILESCQKVRSLDRHEIPSQPNEMPSFALIEIFARNDDRYLCRRELDFDGERLSIICRAHIRPAPALPANNIFIDDN